MAKIWDDEEQVSEYDMMSEEVAETEQMAEAYAQSPVVVQASDEALEEISEESAFDLTQSESNVIFNARLRLEQAKLYEMLINHNIFDGVDASEDAINNVQNELKHYIVKRLEILLGLREPVVKVQHTVAELPFNDIEVDFLKQLAYKGTNGASINGAPVTPTLTKQETIKPLQQAPQPVKPKTLKPASLKPASVKAKVAEPAKAVAQPKPQVQAPVKPQVQAKPPVQAKPQVKAPPKKQIVGDTGFGREMTGAEAEAIARADLAATPNKPFHEMTAKEKAERIKQVNEKHQRPKANNTLPMPTADQLLMKYTTQEAHRSDSRDSTTQFNTMIATALAAQKTRGDSHDE